MLTSMLKYTLVTLIILAVAFEGRLGWISYLLIAIRDGLIKSLAG